MIWQEVPDALPPCKVHSTNTTKDKRNIKLGLICYLSLDGV